MLISPLRNYIKRNAGVLEGNQRKYYRDSWLPM